MKFMTWNIQDGGALDLYCPHINNIKNILSTIEKENPDVLIIQEYQSEFFNELVRDGITKLGYTHTVCEEHPDKTLRKRVLIASKKSFKDLDASANILDYSKRNWREIILDDNSIRILGIHVPLATTTNIYNIKKDNKREKKIFLDALKSKFIEYQKRTEPCVICGDFNLHSEAIYKEYLEEFANYLTEVTTTESTHGKYKFDYIFANDAFKKRINTTERFMPHPTKFSDHSYLCVTIA